MTNDTIEVIVFKILHNSPIFLILRRRIELGGFWQPVVGQVNAGESYEVAVHRECAEEVGLKKKDIRLFIPEFYSFSISRHYLTSKAIDLFTEHVYAIEVLEDFTPELSMNPDREHDQYLWAGYKQAVSYFKWQDNKEALKVLFKGISMY